MYNLFFFSEDLGASLYLVFGLLLLRFHSIDCWATELIYFGLAVAHSESKELPGVCG